MRALLTNGRPAVLAAVVLTASFGGFAWAGSTSSGVITACVHRHGAGLYVGRCARGDKTLSWNRRGPQGPRGPQGHPGPAGPGAVAINNDGIPNGTTMLLWSNAGAKQTLSIACQNLNGNTAFIIASAEDASVNGFAVSGALDLNGPVTVKTIGAGISPGSSVTVFLGSSTDLRNEGQLEIAKIGVGAPVYTFSFHEHVDNGGGCHIQATIFPAS